MSLHREHLFGKDFVWRKVHGHVRFTMRNVFPNKSMRSAATPSAADRGPFARTVHHLHRALGLCNAWRPDDGMSLTASRIKALTLKRLRDLFILAFLTVKTRRVVLSPATFHPDAAWVARQAEVFVKRSRADGLRIGYLQRGRDGKFGDAFDATLPRLRVKTIRSAPQSPNTQAFVERFIGSIRRECLDHFVFFGVRHLDLVANSVSVRPTASSIRRWSPSS
jgi:transposase InsO family protein